MNYYEVLVGDMHYHGKTALTYASEESLSPGAVVRIALRARSALGIVLQQVPEPSFATKTIAAVAPSPPLPAQSLQLLDWLYEYYPAPFGAVIRQFLPPTSAFPKQTVGHDEAIETPKAPPALTPAQVRVLAGVSSSGYHLLHGITGSGKTRIYLELTIRALDAGQSAIILTPEIGLTAQLIDQFTAVFPGKVIVLHSRQTAAQRRDAWYRVLSEAEPHVIIGPRSALFAPVRNLGLIVMDESHDQAYKNENSPHYRTERVAATLARLHDATLISGSATPNVEEYFLAEAKKRPILRLDALATDGDHEVSTITVDLRDRSQLTRSPIIANQLITALGAAVQRGEQGLLFLNRRGTAGAVLCNNCGWQALCDHCDLPLTYHGDAHHMRCHTCGRTWPMPTSCPDCGHTELLFKSIGTKALVDEVRRLFPDVRIRRFDSDVDKSEQLETAVASLRAGDADIIVGTQMITKGLDLPKLSVVGILNADSSLLIPDYTAAERTFQLLSQVIGRAGRGHRGGTIIVQSYNPDTAVIQAAVAQDWAGFYATQISERKAFRFPPFQFLLRLTCTRASSTSAERAAQAFKRSLEETYPRLTIEGPSPAFHPREGGKYKWQLIVKSSSRSALVDIVRELPSGWQHDLDPTNLL